MPSNKVDIVIFVDNAKQPDNTPLRRDDVETAIRGNVDAFSYIHLDLDHPELARESFKAQLLAALEGRKGVMVITSCPSAVRGGILATTREVEKTTGIGTRKIIISCQHGRQINTGFKKRGIPTGDFRHVRYYSEAPERHIGSLSKLF